MLQKRFTGRPSIAGALPAEGPSSAYRYFSFAMGLLIWLTLISFPGPPRTSLEESWNETLIHAAAQHWQFGKDLVFTYGPLGYLTSPYHLGLEGAAVRIAWETVGKLILAAGLVYAIRRKSVLTQLAFVSGSIWSSWIFGGTFYLVVIGILIVEVMLSRDEKLWVQLCFVVGLAFLAQIKFTNLVLAGFGIGVAVGYFGWIGRPRTAGSLAAAFLVALLLWWTVAGQDVMNFGPYLSASWKMASGYSASMGVDETMGVFLTGLTISIGWLIFVCQLACRKTERRNALAVAAFLAFNAFIWWKYGFTRADGHTNSLYLATILFSIVLPASLSKGTKLQWFWVFGLLSLLAFRNNEPALFPVSFKYSLTRLKGNLADLAHCTSFPQRWENQLGAAEMANLLPATNGIVGSNRIDLVSYDQGLLLLNRLNFTPRPVFQGYSVYLPALGRLNLDFYRSRSAPDFILWRQETIDSRFPTIDDAQLYPEIPRSYSVAGHEAGFILLKKTAPVPSTPLDKVLIVKGRLKFHDSLRVPPSHGRPIWLQTGFRLSKLGIARAAFYKPPQLFMTVADTNGALSTWRILPDVAADGFVLSPLLLTTADFEAFIVGGVPKAAATLSFSPAAGQDYLWEKTLRIGFYALAKPPAGSGR